MNLQQGLVLVGVFCAFVAGIYGMIMAFSNKSPYQDYKEEGFLDDSTAMWIMIGMSILGAIVTIFLAFHLKRILYQ